MQSIELRKKNDVSLIAVINEDGKVTNFLTCRFFVGTREYGDQWCWGHYFGDDLKAALDDFENRA